MYYKDELLSKGMPELVSIAEEFGIDTTTQNEEEKENLVYDILEKQATVEAAKNPMGTKRKRTRIVKKDATDHVYSVNGKEGENFDVKKNKTVNAEQPSLFKEDTDNAPKEQAENQETVEQTETVPEREEKTAEEKLAALPKHRGRKSKKELELLAEIEASKKEDSKKQKEVAAETENVMEGNTTPADAEQAIPEAEFANNEQQNTDEGERDLIAQLQEKINAHHEGTEDSEKENYSDVEDAIWKDDPDDGTDFITVVDIPIEDQGAMPTYDMFDNPTTPLQQPAPVYQATAESSDYDFADLIIANGVLEIMPDGYGFLRSSDYNYLSSPDDVYVATNLIKKYGLKTGDVVQCHVRPPHDGEKYFPLTNIDKINGREPSEIRDRMPFEHLTPLFPEEKFSLCGDKATTNLSTRIVDLFSPIGKG